MANEMAIGANSSLIIGTTGVNGTNSELFDLQNYELYGLSIDNMSSGTINFDVASYDPRAGNNPIGTLRALRNLDGSVIATGTLSGNVALSLDAMRVLAPFRYVVLQFSAQQANNPTIRWVVKS